MPYVDPARHGPRRAFAIPHARRPMGLLDMWPQPALVAMESTAAGGLSNGRANDNSRTDAESNELPPGVVDLYRERLDEESRAFFRHGPRTHAEELAFAQRVHPRAHRRAIKAAPELQERFQRWRDIDWGSYFVGPDGAVYERSVLAEEPDGARLRRAYESAVGGFKHPSLDELLGEFDLPDPREGLSESTRAKIANVESADPPRSAAQEAWRAWASQQRVNPDTWRLAERRPEIDQDDYRLGASTDLPEASPGLFVGPDGFVYRHNDLTREDLLTEIGRGMAEHRRIEAQRATPAQVDWSALWDGLALGGFFGGIGGRRGGAKTRDELERIVRSLDRREQNLKHAKGSRNEKQEEVSEEYIAGPGGGRENAIYPDATFRTRTGRPIELRLEQQDVNPRTGKATMRELDKALRLFRFTQSHGRDDEPWSYVHSVLKQHQLRKIEEALRKSKKNR